MWLYALQLSKFRTRILDKINGKFRAISSLQIKDGKMVPFGLHAASFLLSGRGGGKTWTFCHHSTLSNIEDEDID